MSKTIQDLIAWGDDIIKRADEEIARHKTQELESITSKLNGQSVKPKDAVVLHYPSVIDPHGDHQYCPMCLNNWLHSCPPPNLDWKGYHKAMRISKAKTIYPWYRCPDCGWLGQDRYITISLNPLISTKLRSKGAKRWVK